MTPNDEQFVAGMAHCYHLLAQELRVKREAFQTVWDFYYEHVDFVGDAESTVSKELAFASSVIEHLETNLKCNTLMLSPTIATPCSGPTCSTKKIALGNESCNQG